MQYPNPCKPGSYLRFVKSLTGPHCLRLTNLVSSGITTPTSHAWLAQSLRELDSPFGERLLRKSNEYGLQPLIRVIRQAYGLSPEHTVALVSGAFAGLRFLNDMASKSAAHSEVIIESPVYQPIAELFGRAPGKLHQVERGEGFLCEVLRKINRNTTYVVLSNPHNPSGELINAEELTKFARDVSEVNTATSIVVDEVYADASIRSGTTAASLHENIVAVNSLTKVYGASSLRMGWVIAHAKRFPTLLDDWNLYVGIGSRILESQSYCFLHYISEMRAEILPHLESNRACLSAWFDQMRSSGVISGEVPLSGCVAFPELTMTENSLCVAEAIARDFGVLVAPGSYFSSAADRHIRISFGGCTEDLVEGLQRLSAGLMSRKASG